MASEKQVKNRPAGSNSAEGRVNNQSTVKKASTAAPARKGSVYKQQLMEKQKVKRFYGVSEEQFRRFFSVASKSKSGATGTNLLCLLERRADNVIYRLKLAMTRRQARQMVVHGHILLNGKRIKTPSLLVKEGDHISLADKSLAKDGFMHSTTKQRINVGVKVPDWLELRKDQYLGIVSRLPQRADVHVQAEEHLIVELYSK